MSLALKGFDTSPSREAAAYINRYVMQKEYAELGFRFDIKDLNCLDGEAFDIILDEIAKVKKEQGRAAKKASKRKR
ncbi:hypothetical protein EKK58_08540 [Candidatus Dependentiae bacterium]|nr:MAG: hypothetical protein EKK58_08540 [Candidatus Dependentiae bacterium]